MLNKIKIANFMKTGTRQPQRPLLSLFYLNGIFKNGSSLEIKGRLVDQQQDFPGGSDSKVSVYNAGDPGWSPGLGRSPGEGNGNPLQYYYLEKPMDRGAWQATVYGVAKSPTQLSNFTSLSLSTYLLILSFSLFLKFESIFRISLTF